MKIVLHAIEVHGMPRLVVDQPVAENGDGVRLQNMAWEVDGVDDNGCHTIWFEYECQCPCDGCEYAKKGESK